MIVKVYSAVERIHDRESGLRGSVDGRDVAVRLAEPSLALLTVRVFVRCGGPCCTTQYIMSHRTRRNTDHFTSSLSLSPRQLSSPKFGLRPKIS